MNQAEKAELLEQIEKWNDADEFARCIEAIEAIPEQERDYLLTLKLGRAYSNLAVLGDHGALGENAEVDGDLLRHAIDLLESVRTQGENDPYWNARMGYSCLMAYSSAATAYEYAKRWLALAPDDPDAQKLVRDCEEYLEEGNSLELDWNEREEIIRRETIPPADDDILRAFNRGKQMRVGSIKKRGFKRDAVIEWYVFAALRCTDSGEQAAADTDCRIGAECSIPRGIKASDCGKKAQHSLLDQILAVPAGQKQRAGTGPDQPAIPADQHVLRPGPAAV